MRRGALVAGSLLALGGGFLPVTASEPVTTRSSASGEAVEIRQFVFTGNTVFTSADLDLIARHSLADARSGIDLSKELQDPPAVIRKWKSVDATLAKSNRAAHATIRLTVEDLETIRGALTDAYLGAGYVNSSAELPDQDVNNRSVRYFIHEGTLSRVTIVGVDKDFKPTSKLHFNKGYIERRIRVSAGKILNVKGLQNELEILKQNPNLTRVNAELKPDLAPNQSLLELQLEEANRFHLGIDFNNRRSPSVGAERFELIGSDTNVTGFSDPLNIRYTITDGDLEHIGFAGGDDYGFDYTHPIMRYGTTAQIALDRSDEPIIETPFSALSIRSETDSYGLTIRQPLYHRADSEFAIFGTLNLRENKTELDGRPFEFSPGEDNGKSRVTVLRFGQEYTMRDEAQALSVRSTLSFGIHAFGSTINQYDAKTQTDIPDSVFFDWLGQVQYVRRIEKTDSQLVLRTNVQLSASPLLALEQFSIGGLDTVRGYRENQIVRDQGVVTSAELHIPIYKKNDDFTVTLAPFIDLGYGWNYQGAGGDYPVLGSAGIGILVHAYDHLDAQIYWGHPFKYYGKTSNLQDNGIHFDILMSLF
jgi:hemolysin activation/secretion protein